jgi:4-diphosphocytidyl-2-C-methyl-D-erythritol kinase
MLILSPAKINLHLRVGHVNEDGFHPLMSWMVAVGLFDTLEFISADVTPDTFEFSPAHPIEIICNDPKLPTDERNLITKAARLLMAEASSIFSKKTQTNFPHSATGVTDKPLRLRLTKTIPTGGGLGGGSSNAAATLVALNTLWKLKLEMQVLCAIAARLGSDVPFFLHGPSSICTGRGHIVQPVHTPACPWALLMLPDISMPTPAVYQRLDEMHPTDFTLCSADAWNQPPDWTQWASLPAEQLLRHLQNDLEAPAFSLRPDLGALRSAAEQYLARPVRMSGSGSTLFTLYDTQQSAAAAARDIQSRLQINTASVRICEANILPGNIYQPSMDADGRG